MAEPSQAASLLAAQMVAEDPRGIEEEVADEEILDPSSEEASAAPEAQQAEDDPVVELPDFAPVELDEDEPEEDDEEELPPAAEYDEYQDPEDLQKQLHKLRKELEFHKTQRASDNQKRWRQSAEKRFPLADFDSITATSRRSFERAAAQSHNANYNILKPHLDAFKTAKATLKETALAEAKAEATAAWGTATTGPGQPPSEAREKQEKLEKARATGDLSKIIGAMRRG